MRNPLKLLPTPFWCYVLPMLASSVGWIPRESLFYSFASQQILPICLFLLLIGTDLRSLIRMGPLALRIMLAGSVGTFLGGWIAFHLYQRWLPPGSWGAVGALTASWIGGSANLLAVKEAVGVPDSLIGSVILVDMVVAYSWMALLIAAAAWEPAWNRLIATGSAGVPARGIPPRAPQEAGRARCPQHYKGRGRARPDARARPPRWGGRAMPGRNPRAGVALARPRRAARFSRRVV